MTQSQVSLEQVVAQMRALLDPASGLPLSRKELMAKLEGLGADYSKSRAEQKEAALINEAIGVAVQLKARTGEMASETAKLMQTAVTTYQKHFGEDDDTTTLPVPPVP